MNDKSAAVPKKLGVYHDRGYLLLVLGVHGKKVFFTRANEGNWLSDDCALFLAAYDEKVGCSGAALALNLLSRVVAGSFKPSVKVYRRLLNMIEANKEQLLELSMAILVREYNRIVNPSPLLIAIPDDQREQRITEILGAADRVSIDEVESPDPNNPNPEGVSTAMTKATKSIKGTKKKAATGAAAAAKAKSLTREPFAATAASVANPFREGSMKYKCYELFRKGGERSKILEGIEKMGATPATARSWCNLFTKVKDMPAKKLKEVKPPKPKAEKKAKKKAT